MEAIQQDAAQQKISWWPYVVSGITLIIVGIMVLAWPDITLFVLVILFGSLMIVDGILTMITGLIDSKGGWRWFYLIAGALSIVVGLCILAWPDITAKVVLYLLGAWAIIAGFTRIITATFWPKEHGFDRWMLILVGVIAIIIGAVILAWPVSGALAIVWILGLLVITFGILLIAAGFSIMKSNKRVT